MCYLLSERIIDSEFLPPAFGVKCPDPACGWRGKNCRGMAVFVIGANAPIAESVYPYVSMRCPKCKKSWQSLTDKESFAARFRFVVEKLSGFGHHGDLFPCTCEAQPGCRVVSDIELKMSIASDSFINDEPWMRTMAQVKCTGCYAVGKVALLEKHPVYHFYREPWVIEVGDYQLTRGVVVG